MAGAPDDIEELALCSWCRRAFDDADRPPKVLACKHHFCLECARGPLAGAGGGVRCAHCARRTDPPAARADRLPTHTAVLALARRLLQPAETTLESVCSAHGLPALWCVSCGGPGCRACPEHASHAHALRPALEARALVAGECRALTAELRRLAARHRDLVVRALHATTALKLRLETELAAGAEEASEAGEAGCPGAAHAELERLRAAHTDALLRARVEDAVRCAGAPLDFDRLRRALSPSGPAGPTNGLDDSPPPDEARDPLVFLSNYCAGAAFVRRYTGGAGGGCGGAGGAASGASSPLVRAPSSSCPLLFLELEVDGRAWGRVVVEARADVAPRMARNFEALCVGAGGVGYRGCSVFQCWEGESVITGDVELNNGRGGRAALHGPFLPDESRLGAVRGAVGMRRSQKRHDNLGLVASQFRIVLREMRGFTAIFGFVAEGLELVDRVARTGDSAGKPHATIIISSCGRLN